MRNVEKDCIVFKGTDSVNEMLDYVLQFKREVKKVKKNVKNKIHLLAHKRSGLESYVVLNNLHEWRTVVCLVKKGLGIVSFEKFNGYVDQNKKIRQNVHFECGLFHKKNSLKNRKKL